MGICAVTLWKELKYEIQKKCNGGSESDHEKYLKLNEDETTTTYNWNDRMRK
jgi:hypothetical protein